ncbi:hypothetical protein JN00_0103 [Metamycoplasma subdolum]|uniref:Uncharacterized protein n=1 Tax=Metamycoplasma subdolum TaxID=92407 RepID=A0A3M0A330_9BACT|nr:hypothetical protein [Metamycoplasma subdolum]RMA79056.1 hypothetical protein JN00_0103 [Metamycoplasma subdolum]WPB50579.1 hypothetical protein R9C05_00235 [Metamycoplasma subdolum]
MKFKKILLASLTVLPTVSLISVSCGDKTPKLDELKELIKNSSVDTLLEGVERVETPSKPEELEEGKKQVANSAVTTYEEALTAAKAVTEEAKASEAKTTLEAAINALKGAIVVGTKAKVSTTPKLDALKKFIDESTVEKLLPGVEQVDKTEDPATLTKERRQITKAAVATYETALSTAKTVTEEDKADAAKTTLEEAIKTLKAAVVKGTKSKAWDQNKIEEFGYYAEENLEIVPAQKADLELLAGGTANLWYDYTQNGIVVSKDGKPPFGKKKPKLPVAITIKGYDSTEKFQLTGIGANREYNGKPSGKLTFKLEGKKLTIQFGTAKFVGGGAHQYSINEFTAVLDLS